MGTRKAEKANLGNIQYMAPARLKPHPENDFRDIYDTDYTNLKDSIQANGILHPILVDSQLRILSGAQRARAARQLGLMSVPVLNMGTLSRKRAREIIIDANLCQRHLTKKEFAHYFNERYGKLIDDQLQAGARAGDLVKSIAGTSGLEEKRVAYRVHQRKTLLETMSLADEAAKIVESDPELQAKVELALRALAKIEADVKRYQQLRSEVVSRLKSVKELPPIALKSSFAVDEAGFVREATGLAPVAITKRGDR